MTEATATDTPYGRYITSEGWFVLNLDQALAVTNDQKGGTMFPLESREHPFSDFGAHVRVLEPGQPNALYHSEGVQEGFLVLCGECTLIVEDEERAMRQWDYFHCPAGTAHVFVGAGSGPCAVLMLGRRPDEPILYPANSTAQRYGASVSATTDSPEEAYADWPGEYEPARMPWPPDGGSPAALRP
jgi:uncharacterized cupin superfamily protein